MVIQKHISTRAWSELFLLGVIWGGVFLTAAIALKEIPPFSLVAIRITLAALVLWVLALLRHSPIPKGWRTWRALFVMGILNNAIPFTLLTLGQTQIESGLTSIFNAGTAVFGILIAAIFLKDERLTHRKLIGVILGISGIIFTVGYESLQTFDLRSLGQIACICATISYAFAGVWARKNLSGLSPDSATAGMLTSAALVTIPIAFFAEGAPTFSYSLQTWGALLYYVPIATAFAYLLYFRILEMAGSANTLLVTLLVSPVAIALGAVILNETLPTRAFIGFALIALGLAVIDGRLWKLARRTFSTARGSAIPR